MRAPTAPKSGQTPPGNTLWTRRQRFPRVSPSVQHRIKRLAAQIRREDPDIDDTTPFGMGVRRGIGPGPGIWFGDIAEIPLLGGRTGKHLDYRFGWLARSGDVVVIGAPSCPSFEAYQRRWLKEPGITYLNVDPASATPRRATAALCLHDEAAYRGLIVALGNCSGVTLHSHLTTGTTWALAARLHANTGRQVHVAGPPPMLSRRTNDKIWFGDVTRELLGAGAVPLKRAAHSVSALTRHVSDLARKWDRLVVKVPDSAGSEGNFPLKSEEIRGLRKSALKDRLLREMTVNGRGPSFPMLVEVWDANVLTSPSVQIWIPDRQNGPPVIEGVFEQMLTGEGAAFCGAAEANLPPGVDNAVCQEAMQLALLFQRLGFFGRCSFDTLVSGANGRDSTIHWIECNARWGGVSVPMSLFNRMTAGVSAPHYVVIQNDRDRFRPVKFASALVEFAEFAPPADLTYGIIFLSPNLMEIGTGCHFISFGTTRASATEQAQSVIRRLQISA